MSFLEILLDIDISLLKPQASSRKEEQPEALLVSY
jgi:hypothetical protein